MGFDWTEFIKLAEFLRDYNATAFAPESGYRSAVSRCYFAAYCYARDYAVGRLGFVANKAADDHTRLREHFKKRNMMVIAQKLDRLREWRNECDYENEIPSPFPFLLGAISAAKHVLKLK